MTLIQAQTTGIQEKNSSTLPAIKRTYRTAAPEFHKNSFFEKQNRDTEMHLNRIKSQKNSKRRTDYSV